MDENIYCQVHISGHFSNRWSDWFESLTIDNQPNGEAILYGWLPDQAAFFGVLNHMRDLGMTLIYLEMISSKNLLANSNSINDQQLTDSQR